jgi:uncharacterized membrane protein
MLTLALGLALFLVVHLVPTNPQLRSGLADRFGEVAYKIAFSLVSLAGLALIVMGYAKLQAMPGKNPQLWYPPIWARHAAFALMWPALVLLVAAYVPSNIRTRVGHPMLAAIKIWAFAHLIANGDLAGVLIFACFLAYAVYDRVSVKRRGATGPLGEAKGGIGGDAVAIVVGTGLYAFLLYGGHRLLIGKPLIAAGF